MKSKPFKHKTIVICSILIVITLFSIGFASWIVNNKYVESNIKIEIGKINNFNQFEFGDISTFTFNKDGILKNDIYQQKGDIQIQFLIKLRNGLALENYNRDNLNLQFFWESTNPSLNLNEYISNNQGENIKYTYSFISYEDAVSKVISTTSTSFTFENNVVQSTLNTNITSNDIINYESAYFVVNFAYDFSNVFNTFETSIYNNLIKDGGTFFKLSLGVTS